MSYGATTQKPFNQDVDDTIVVQDVNGSSVIGAIFNFSNGIVGAGAIGLAGAIAQSGGLVSVISILFFGVFAKASFDLVITLAVNTEGAEGSYEELGRVAFGTKGRLAVLISKLIYTFGCLVAYVKIVQDNFSTATHRLIYGCSDFPIRVDNDDVTTVGSAPWLSAFLHNDGIVTVIVGIIVMLPLCLLRDMTPLEKFSVIKISAVTAIALIVMFLYIANPNNSIRLDGGSVYEKWFEIRPNIFQSLGTFVFTFVSQHTVHLTYESLRPNIRDLYHWKQVSTWTCFIATVLSMSIGLFLYMSFWEEASSAAFELYPPLASIDIAKLLLSIMIMLTYPLAFFSCREMIIIALPVKASQQPSIGDTEQALLASSHTMEEKFPPFWMIPGEDKQLRLPYHVALTVLLWGITTLLAIVAPSLGDVLNLVGCATGTLIAFILPAMFSFQLEGYTHVAAIIFVVGGIIGCLGTVLSFKQLLSDATER
mmetsp:Transcript_26763/g.37737  ORF Transcript_26763/g.37737 Transcript_26763/m.37737 type:complete len:481 (-) Transcript_26763:15-1457(-)